jgi:hypothetical protein
MDSTTLFFTIAIIGSALFLFQYVGFNLSATSVLLSLLLALHGPAYLYYTRIWGPDTEFFEHILTAAPEGQVIPALDISLGLLFIFVCIGIIITDLLTGSTPQKMSQALSEFCIKNISATKYEKNILFVLVISSLILMLPFIFINNQIYEVINYFTSDLGEFEKIALRREGAEGGSYIYNLLASNIFPFVAFSIVAGRTAGDRRHTLLFIFFLLILALSKAATLSKAPLALFLLELFVVFFISKSLQIRAKTLVYLMVFALIAFSSMALVANPTLDGISALLDFLFYRFFMVVNDIPVQYFSAIPSVIPHSWNILPSWLGSEFVFQAYWLVAEVHTGGLESTSTGMFLCDAWAAFGWTGIVLDSLLIGAFVRLIDVSLIMFRGPSIFTIAALALAYNGIFIALNTAMSTAMLTGGLLLVIPLANLSRIKLIKTSKV